MPEGPNPGSTPTMSSQLSLLSNNPLVNVDRYSVLLGAEVFIIFFLKRDKRGTGCLVLLSNSEFLPFRSIKKLTIIVKSTETQKLVFALGKISSHKVFFFFPQ